MVDDRTLLLRWQEEQRAMCEADDPTGGKPWLNVSACGYFIDEYVKIYDKGTRRWIDFELWPKQWDALEVLMCNGRVAILKARQLGLTWLCLAMCLWKLCFMPGTAVMLFSLRQDEAEDLLRRLYDMWCQLPEFMRMGMDVKVKTSSLWLFENDNSVRAFSTSSGDSYQANVVLIDEATLVPNLRNLLGRLEPVVDSVPNGYLWLISRSNKDDPKNLFNDIYVDGRRMMEDGQRSWSDYVGYFLSWRAAIWRDEEWYERVKAKELRTKRHLDDLYSMYPNDDVEALAPSTANKRILRSWVMDCYEERMPLDVIPDGIRYVSDLRVYHRVVVGGRYVIGIDTAEGLPTSNNTCICVVDYDTGEEVATLCGKISPGDTADEANALSEYYNHAPILCERNNHGHAVLLALDLLDAYVMDGPDEMPGYRSGTQSKIQLYDCLAEAFKDTALHNEDVGKLGGVCRYLVHSHDLALEIMSIERLTLACPENHLDDMSDAFAFAQMGRTLDLMEGIQVADYTMF